MPTVWFGGRSGEIAPASRLFTGGVATRRRAEALVAESAQIVPARTHARGEADTTRIDEEFVSRVRISRNLRPRVGSGIFQGHSPRRQPDASPRCCMAQPSSAKGPGARSLDNIDQSSIR